MRGSISKKVCGGVRGEDSRHGCQEDSRHAGLVFSSHEDRPSRRRSSLTAGTAVLPIFHALDIGTEHEEFFINVFVTAVDVIEAADLGGAFCRESGEHERGGGA
jgi:hypothetical protein